MNLAPPRTPRRIGERLRIHSYTPPGRQLQKHTYLKKEFVDGRYVTPPQAPVKGPTSGVLPFSNVGPSCLNATLANLIQLEPVIGEHLTSDAFQKVVDLNVCQIMNGWRQYLLDITGPNMVWALADIDDWSWKGCQEARHYIDELIPDLDDEGEFTKNCMVFCMNSNPNDNHSLIMKPTGLLDVNVSWHYEGMKWILREYGPKQGYNRWFLVQPMIIGPGTTKTKLRMREEQEKRYLKGERSDLEPIPYGGMMQQEGPDCSSKAIVHLVLGSSLIYHLRANKEKALLNMLYNVCPEDREERLGNELTTALFMESNTEYPLSFDNIKWGFKQYAKSGFMEDGIINVGPLMDMGEEVEHSMAYVGGHLVDSNFSKSKGYYDDKLVQTYINLGCTYFKATVVVKQGATKPIPWKLIQPYYEMRKLLDEI